jgi:diguanylate cyclase (GGDEF)-like protein
LLDLDRFKRINDTHGHDAGDAALIAVTRQIQGVLRRDDLLARIGGEEFAALLPDTTSAAAVAIAERIRRLVAETPVSAEDQEIRTTVSIGVAARPPEARREVGLNSLMRRADRALYQAKAAGRNRCRMAAESDGEASEEPRLPLRRA